MLFTSIVAALGLSERTCGEKLDIKLKAVEPGTMLSQPVLLLHEEARNNV